MSNIEGDTNFLSHYGPLNGRELALVPTNGYKFDIDWTEVAEIANEVADSYNGQVQNQSSESPESSQADSYVVDPDRTNAYIADAVESIRVADEWLTKKLFPETEKPNDWINLMARSQLIGDEKKTREAYEWLNEYINQSDDGLDSETKRISILMFAKYATNKLTDASRIKTREDLDALVDLWIEAGKVGDHEATKHVTDLVSKGLLHYAEVNEIHGKDREELANEINMTKIKAITEVIEEPVIDESEVSQKEHSQPIDLSPDKAREVNPINEEAKEDEPGTEIVKLTDEKLLQRIRASAFSDNSDLEALKEHNKRLWAKARAETTNEKDCREKHRQLCEETHGRIFAEASLVAQDAIDSNKVRKGGRKVLKFLRKL